MKQIGYIILNKEKVFTNGFECAAWYEDIIVQPGRYPLYTDRIEGGKVSMCYASLPGTIKSDNFQSLYFGSPIGKCYDEKQNEGKEAKAHFMTYAYNVADEIHNPSGGEYEYELLPEFTAYERAGISIIDGKPITFHGIERRAEV